MVQGQIDIDLGKRLCGGLDVLASLDPTGLGGELLLGLGARLLVRVVLVLVLLVLLVLVLLLVLDIRSFIRDR